MAGDAVPATLDAFDAALRRRDRAAAEAVRALDRPEVSALGSPAGDGHRRS